MDANSMLLDISMEYLQQTKVYTEMQKCMSTIEKVQMMINASAAEGEDKKFTALKTGSVLSVSIFEMMLKTGKFPKDFSQSEWASIAGKSLEIGVLADGQVYTAYVFDLYAKYIDVSVKVNATLLSDKKKAEISGLADDLRRLTADLHSGRIKETDYVDRCLWISFDAMMKLLSVYVTKPLGKEYGELVQAISDLAVQYARYSLYSKEQAILSEYLRHQSELDEDLQAQYDAYIAELNEKSKEFKGLIQNAFDPDFREKLRSSVDLARAAGVQEDQILDSQAKIDDFFS